MKNTLPPGHGLSEKLAAELIRTEEGSPSLTDAQYGALEAGAAKGSNVLVVAPTSSGKTGVGLFAISSWLTDESASNRKAVYLTSHRALARQKSNDFLETLPEILGFDRSEFVVATGDAVVDGMNEIPADPLDAALLTATYEKFLGLIAASGLRKDMSHYCIVCDELQLINDPNRGSTVEVLLTLLKRAGFGQVVGLSAVIAKKDATAIANWLGGTLIHSSRRETPITYEVRSNEKTILVSTNREEEFVETAGTTTLKTIDIVAELAKDPENLPIAVFCMRRQDVFDLSKQWAILNKVPLGEMEEIPPEFVEITNSARDLACYAPYEFGYHSADLVDEERHFVEDRLDRNEFKVVFSTTTLAMGLNYSFRTVVFDRFKRWSADRKQHEPILRSEFHNIAGRAGRLGYAAEGRVIVSALTRGDFRAAANYLRLSEVDDYIPRLRPENFENISLQLLASGIVNEEFELIEFLQSTLSAQTELEINRFQTEIWAEQLNLALNRLKQWGFIH